MSGMHRKWKALGVTALLALGWLGPSAAFAQPKKEMKLPPYDVKGLDTGSVWVPWLFVAAFIGGALAIAFKNPRRSHLD